MKSVQFFKLTQALIFVPMFIEDLKQERFESGDVPTKSITLVEKDLSCQLVNY